MKAIAVGSLLLGGLAFSTAQTVVPIDKQGAYSIGFSLDYFNPQGGTATTTINVMPAYFITNNISIGVPFTWTHVSGSDDTSIGVDGRFLFLNGPGKVPPQFQPFVGVVYNTEHATGGSTDQFWGGEVGAHYFVANNVSITGNVVFGRDRVAGVSNNSTEVFVGLTIFFAGSGK